MQVEFLQTGDAAAPGATGATGVTGAPRSAVAAQPLPRTQDPLESELTLDALKDAQADLVARVESTARDLHDSLETGGRMAHPNHLRTARYQPPVRSAAGNPTAGNPTAGNPAAGSAPAPPPPPAPPAPAAPAAEAAPIQLTEADLNGEQLKEARDKLDNVLDDVMGSVRPATPRTPNP